jgi:hypothetical protein
MSKLPEIFRPHEGKREPNVLSDALLDEIPNPEAAEEEEDESDEPE